MSFTPRTVRVALLICSQFTIKRHGSTLEIFERWLNDALPPNSGVELHMHGYDVVKEEYPASGDLYDVVMVTGSPADAFGGESWIRRLVCYLQHIHNKHQHVRLFGICFGHQIISRALGGKVVRNQMWECGLTPVRVTHVGKMIFGVERLYELQQIHQDHVPLDTLSDYFSSGSIYLLGSSPRTPNQGFVKFYEHCKICEEQGRVHELHEHIHVMTVQGHPEFTDAVVTDIIYRRAKKRTIGDYVVEAYFGKAGPPVASMEESGPETRWPYDYDGISVVGKAFWKMFGVKYEV